MLRSLHVEGYRRFSSYTMDGLRRVNLLVGKNNCGKTSLLEAAHLLASAGDPKTLTHIALDRGEAASAVGAQDEQAPMVGHFFHGHALGLGTTLNVKSGDNLGTLSIKIVGLRELDPSLSTVPVAAETQILWNQLSRFHETEIRQCDRALHVKVVRDTSPNSTHVLVPINEDGQVLVDVFKSLMRYVWRQSETNEFPIEWLGIAFQPHKAVFEKWDHVVRRGQEEEVVDSLRLIQPNLKDLFFLSSQSGTTRRGLAGILAGVQGAKERVPLGTFGDGMQRLLALSLSLIHAQNGLLLLDEIDTGLHYSVMGDMWLMLAAAAKKADVQILATTHSLDCVRGLAWLCQNHPELAPEVALVKVDERLDRSVTFHDDEIVRVVENDVEVR